MSDRFCRRIPEAFRRRVYRRAARLRRRRIATYITGGAAAATAVLVLVLGHYAPFVHPSSGHPAAVGVAPTSSAPSTFAPGPTVTTSSRADHDDVRPACAGDDSWH